MYNDFPAHLGTERYIDCNTFKVLVVMLVVAAVVVVIVATVEASGVGYNTTCGYELCVPLT